MLPGVSIMGFLTIGRDDLAGDGPEGHVAACHLEGGVAGPPGEADREVLGHDDGRDGELAGRLALHTAGPAGT
jgi:hypothetical protein